MGPRSTAAMAWFMLVCLLLLIMVPGAILGQELEPGRPADVAPLASSYAAPPVDSSAPNADAAVLLPAAAAPEPPGGATPLIPDAAAAVIAPDGVHTSAAVDLGEFLVGASDNKLRLDVEVELFRQKGFNKRESLVTRRYRGLSVRASHFCDTKANDGNNGPGYWGPVRGLKITLKPYTWYDNGALKTDGIDPLIKLQNYNTDCKAQDVRVGLYDREYCTGFPGKDVSSSNKDQVEYFLYQASHVQESGPKANLLHHVAFYDINDAKGIMVNSIRPGVILPCSGGKSGFNPPGLQPELPATSEKSKIGIKVVFWPGKDNQYPYEQTGCKTQSAGALKPPPDFLKDNTVFQDYPKSHCWGDEAGTGQNTNIEACQKNVAPGCASGIDRVYCVGMKAWDIYPNSVQDVVGRVNFAKKEGWGYDFANKFYFSGTYPGGHVMVNLYTSTTVGGIDEKKLTDPAETKQFRNQCAPGNPLHWPLRGVCVLTRIYGPPPKDGSCQKSFWLGSDTNNVRSAQADSAIALIGCGMPKSGTRLNCLTKSSPGRFPTGGWGDIVQLNDWPAPVYCAYTRTVDDKDPDCKKLLAKRQGRRPWSGASASAVSTP